MVQNFYTDSKTDIRNSRTIFEGCIYMYIFLMGLSRKNEYTKFHTYSKTDIRKFHTIFEGYIYILMGLSGEMTIQKGKAGRNLNWYQNKYRPLWRLNLWLSMNNPLWYFKTKQKSGIKRASVFTDFLSKSIKVDYSSEAKGSKVHYFAPPIGTVKWCRYV